MAKVLKRVTLRYAVDPTQGRGWCEYRGEHWLNPIARHGVITVLDTNNTPRQLIIDRNDDNAYEFGTYDHTVDTGLPFADKVDVEDAEIETEQWFGEEEANPLLREAFLESQVSHISVRPQNPHNKGNISYDSEGYRTAQSFALDAYIGGSLARRLATAEEIPQDGDITFSGYRVENQRLLFVVKSSASEFIFCGRSHDLVVKPKQGSTAQRTMLRDQQELVLANKYYHISRYPTALYERVSRNTIPGSATLITGPDNRSQSAMTLANSTPLLNTAFTGAYTFLIWIKVGVTVTGLPDALTLYGDSHNGWQLYYARSDSNTLPALTVSAGDVFDIRIYQSNLSDGYLDALHDDIIYNDGNGLLPGY